MRNTKILIVDFDEDSSLALSEYLKSEGFDVKTAGDGEVGLEKCKSEHPDLVIVEPMISKLHGFELCSIISHDFNGQIPVVILTKFYREEQFKIEAMSAYGASAFLSKPFKGPEILSTIKDLLNEKIKESEENDMAEEAQNLEDFSEKALDNIQVEEKMIEAKLQQDDIESEVLELVPPTESVPEKEEKSPDVKTHIDKMLEATLSEFGLNLDEKMPLKTEEKSAAPPEEIVEIAAKDDTVAANAAVAEKESVEDKEVEDEKVEIEEEVKVPDQEEYKESKQQAILTSIAEEETEAAAPAKEDSIFSAMAEEEKKKISPLSVLKNSLQSLKRIPLKFIIPIILVAAVALSASFIFRKSKSTDSTPQNMTAAIQPVKKLGNAVPEEIVIENPDEKEQSQVTSPAQEPPIQSPQEEPKEEEGEVKTKVNEVFAVKDPTPQVPDVERVNMEEDVLSETTASSPELLLAQELPMNSSLDNQASVNTPSEDPADDLTSLGGPGITPEEEQFEEASQTGGENPPVEAGDLIPLEDVDIGPEIAKRVDPKYPSVAFQRGAGGKVLINVLISESGDVIETALIKGIPGPYGFNEDCTNAVRQWKFVPAFKNGVKVKVWKAISFTFKKS
ncbi:MAG TPA: TonB family protein [Candidatus Heimdallarchaeota archaeon]|nr:TonB family protein [Candidatus Heimdallarchaeota archaeon]